jgi:hypothetical protein
MRQDSDYGDFVIYSADDVEPLFNEVKEVLKMMKGIIAQQEN